ncbi:MAG TPA: M1 family metallopeptidase [Clostridiales bacterium]|nr:M1 family metallopeptidase [Clostridiales bacterium]
MKFLSKKHRRYLLIGAAAVILLLTCLFLGNAFGLKTRVDSSLKLIQASRGLNSYDIDVEFDPETKMLRCNQKVEYINKSEDQLDHLYFHLYPNAYQYENKPVFDKYEMLQAYPNGFSPGFIEIYDVRVDGRKANYVIGGYTENVIMLILEGSLSPGGQALIEMDYAVQLPNCLGRFGYGDNMFKVVNWYPIASVYDENGWNLDPYYSIGDPFYSDAANYHVTIKAPADYIIASTGRVKSKREENGSVIWEVDAPAVRDFAWLTSNAFETASKMVEGTMVTSYFFTQEAGMKVLDYAAGALEYYNKVFGKYPYAHFAVVESDFFIGGMEYPNLIMVDHSLYQNDRHGYLELITVHETAHQWWYGLVGNNQIQDAWIDEGLTEYSTVLYYGYKYGEEKEEEIYKSIVGEGKYKNLQVYYDSDDIDETIHKPSYAFENWMLYDILVYGKGSMLFHSLREQMGDKLFFTALNEFFKEYQFRNAGKDDIIRVFNQVSGMDWEQHFNNWLYDE